MAATEHSPGPPPPQRIGLYGGAFDPPHNAHIALARAAVDQLALHRLHIVPTGQAWHKTRALSDAHHRLAMCRLAFAGDARWQVDARELHRDGPSYTVDTLEELRAEHPGAALHLIIGADQAAAFHTWRRAADIARLAQLVIVPRGDVAAPDVPALMRALPGMPPPQLLHLPPLPHSATALRQRVAAGQSIEDLAPPAVARYIADHHLYQQSTA